jgi:hypothetical protein
LSATATQARAWHRSPTRRAYRSRPSTSGSKRRAEFCAHSGSCFCETTTARFRSATGRGSRRCWTNRILSASYRLNIRNATIVRGRIGGLLRVIRDAAPAEPDVANLWSRIQTEFYENQRALHRRRVLRRGLGVVRATDILWTLNHPDVYRLFVNERGWTPEQHERWLADLLCSQLLR